MALFACPTGFLGWGLFDRKSSKSKVWKTEIAIQCHSLLWHRYKYNKLNSTCIVIHCHLTHHPLSSIVILLTIHCHILLWPIPSPAASSLCSCTSWEGNLWDLGKIKTKTDENVWKYIRNMWTYLKIYQNIWKYPAPAGNVTFEKNKKY